MPETLIDHIRAGKIALPSKLSELTEHDNTGEFLNMDMAASFGFHVAKGSARLNRKFMVQNFTWYKIVEHNKERARVGVGVRWLIDITVLNATFKLDSKLPVIAAAAELGLVQTSTQFRITGLTSQKISAASPQLTQVTVGNYAEFPKAEAKIRELMWDAGTKVSPQILSIGAAAHAGLGETEDVYGDALGTAWALSRISKRMPLSDALRSKPGASDGFRRAINVQGAGRSKLRTLISSAPTIRTSRRPRRLGRSRQPTWVALR